MRFAFLQEPPFCFRDAGGNLLGCDAGLAGKVCEGLKLDAFLPIETEFAELLPGLAGNRWDMTTGLFISDERRKLVDFTLPIWVLQDDCWSPKAIPVAFAAIGRWPRIGRR